MNMKERIRNIRFGHYDVEKLSDADLENILDYHLTADVRGLLVTEIARRRSERLER